jgi:hypothetical protein
VTRRQSGPDLRRWVFSENILDTSEPGSVPFGTGHSDIHGSGQLDDEWFLEEEPVSLCIAATCSYEGQPCIIHCCDTAVQEET